MAFIEMNIMSESLMRTVPVNVILPADKIGVPESQAVQRYKTLYLLHGIFGSHVDWVNGTKLQRWAEEKNLCVVMPAGENRFYVDDPIRHDYYGRFIGEELVRLTRRIFPLSPKREDTYIAGLSMGGYGALRNGLKYHETFSHIAGLSAANVLQGVPVDMYFTTEVFLRSIFGDLEKARNSDNSIDWLIDERQKRKETDQKIYLCIGQDDSLLQTNRELCQHFKKAGFDITYEEGPGDHEWDFWNRYIKRVLEWLPLEESSAGISSGNIVA